ncbi:MAG: (deoxy)nucleoside triphosphate pyrophosphohydrolase [Treponema sp.]|nr:(deoxy)nucleoside triphosphate pyrophosphohydrolase [Candidatus Treponema equifaecale]
MKHITVSAAVIHRTNPQNQVHEIFSTARGYGDYKGWWEFPGGKLEVNESPEKCIVREIQEELTAKIQVEQKLGTVEYDYPEFHLTMHCFLCSVVEGELKLLEAEAAQWLSKEDLHSVNWLPADLLILDKVKDIL